MKIVELAAVATAIIYLHTPDILSRPETLLYLIVVFGCSAYFIGFIYEQIERVQRKRRSLVIRKKTRRLQKIIDFPIKSRIKHIPAFPVRKDA